MLLEIGFSNHKKTYVQTKISVLYAEKAFLYEQEKAKI